MIQLSDDQRIAVEKGDAVRVMAPQLGKEVVLLRADLYDTVKELLQEEEDRQVIARIAMRSAVARAQELHDPAG